MTLQEIINQIISEDPKDMISLHNDYGMFWTGQARFVFGALKADSFDKNVKNIISNLDCISITI